MDCEHQGLHTITSSYDRVAKTLSFIRLCEQCGARLTEVSRLHYEPRLQVTPPPGLALGGAFPGTRRPGPARMTEPVTLRFDEFGRRSLESVARRDGRSLDALLAHAVTHFESELRRGRAAAFAPTFLERRAAIGQEIRLALERSRLERLRDEAGQRRVSLERLLEHAALLYLADLDSGRVAGRGGESLGQPHGT